MAVFQYLTKDGDGNRKEGEIHADSLDIAAQKLSSGGVIVVNLKEVDTTWDFLGPFLDEVSLSIERFKNRIPLSNIVFFTRQLYDMNPQIFVILCIRKSNHNKMVQLSTLK